MKDKIIYLSIIILSLSCNQQSDHKTVKENPVDNLKSDTVKNIIERSKDTLQKQTLSPAGDTLFFKLKMDSSGKHLTIPVSISSGQIFFATLFSNDKNANLRITQIGFPDSTFDGPFGKSLQTKIKMPGDYKIIVGENMMAGDPWTGNFEMKVWVK